MAGHSKWHNIKNKKEATDARKGKVFGQLAKQIRIAVKEGGSGDPNFNATLRTILEKARAANMPKVNIQTAIDRGMGKSASGAALQEILYEAFGPGGEGLLIQSITDNPNRTGSEVRSALGRAGASLGGPGSAQYLFDRRGSEFVPKMSMPASDAQIEAIQNLIDKLLEIEDVEEVFTSITMSEESEEL